MDIQDDIDDYNNNNNNINCNINNNNSIYKYNSKNDINIDINNTPIKKPNLDNKVLSLMTKSKETRKMNLYKNKQIENINYINYTNLKSVSKIGKFNDKLLSTNKINDKLNRCNNNSNKYIFSSIKIKNIVTKKNDKNKSVK